MPSFGFPFAGPLGGDISSVAAPGMYARMLAALLPPGPVWRLFEGSILSKALAAFADELHRLHDRAFDLLSESVPADAVELVPEYESELDLDATGSSAERIARIVARYVARQGFRPADLQTALAPLLGQLAEDVDVIETSHAVAVSMGDVREIFRFFIYRDPDLPGDYYVQSAQDLVDTIKPSHTIGHVIESVNFLCDDPFSLCDRDLLGA